MLYVEKLFATSNIIVDCGQKRKINKNFVARKFLSWHRKPVLHFGDDAGALGTILRAAAAAFCRHRGRYNNIIVKTSEKKSGKNRTHNSHSYPEYNGLNQYNIGIHIYIYKYYTIIPYTILLLL